MNKAIEPNLGAALLKEERNIDLAYYELNFHTTNHLPSICFAYSTELSRNGCERTGDTLLLCLVQGFIEASTADNRGIIHCKTRKRQKLDGLNRFKTISHFQLVLCGSIPTAFNSFPAMNTMQWFTLAI